MKVEVEGFHMGDRVTLDLPKIQSDLIKKIHATGKPIILVLLNGSAVSINWENENIPAILEAWYPGQAGGTAIASVISGKYNPAGRLPVTFYKSVDQLPVFNNYDMVGRTYRYFEGEPLYPFGYGLSFTEFEYSDISLSSNNIKPGDSAKVFIKIRNSGNFSGEEVIQLYIKADQDNITQKSLKGFMRVQLNPGESKEISFNITPDLLQRWIENEGQVVAEDTYKIMIGGSSSIKDLISTELNICDWFSFESLILIKIITK